jgi:hypothetical protein
LLSFYKKKLLKKNKKIVKQTKIIFTQFIKKKNNNKKTYKEGNCSPTSSLGLNNTTTSILEIDPKTKLLKI